MSKPPFIHCPDCGHDLSIPLWEHRCVCQPDPLAALLHRLKIECRRDYRGDIDCGGGQYMCHTDPAERLIAAGVTLAPAEGLCDGCGASVLSLRHFEGCPLAAGTTTDCPVAGVHEHVFRGPHRFREWDPADYQPPAPAEGLREAIAAFFRAYDATHLVHDVAYEGVNDAVAALRAALTPEDDR